MGVMLQREMGDRSAVGLRRWRQTIARRIPQFMQSAMRDMTAAV